MVETSQKGKGLPGYFWKMLIYTQLRGKKCKKGNLSKKVTLEGYSEMEFI